MDAFDLANLFAHRTIPALFDGGPVFVPGLLPHEEQELVVATLVPLAAERPLLRVEIEFANESEDRWKGDLQRVVETSHPQDVVVIGRSLTPNTDVSRIERDPLLKQFRSVVVIVPYPGQAPRLGAWGEFLRATREALQAAYPTVSAERGLDEALWRSLRALLPRLSNPLNLVLLANATLDAQLASSPREHQRRSVLSRLVRKEFRWREPAEVMTLLALCAGGEARLASVLPFAPERGMLLARLESQRLWRDGASQDWALALSEPGLIQEVLGSDPSTVLRRDGWKPWFNEVFAALGMSVPTPPAEPDVGVESESAEADEDPPEPDEPAPASVSADSPDGVPLRKFDPRRAYFSVPYTPKGKAVIGRADALQKVREHLERGRPTSIGQATSFVYAMCEFRFPKSPTISRCS